MRRRAVSGATLAPMAATDADAKTGEPVDYVAVTRATYDRLGYPPYRWVANEGRPPWRPLRVPLASARLGLVASGGVYRAGQVAFHHRDDATFRVIDAAAPVAELRATHFAYDLTDARADPNVVFPLDPLRALVAEGVLGELAPEAYAFMGGIYSARLVRDELAPALAERLLAQRVDCALLVPV